MKMQDRLQNAFEVLKSRTSFRPETIVVLGSGLGSFAASFEIEEQIDFSELPEFPVPTAPGHRGCFLFGHSDGVSVAVLPGRLHYYEGFAVEETVMPLRLMRMLGAENLILTNASGVIHPGWTPGEFMLIEDHISSFVPSPLRGPNIETLGLRYTDMTRAYDADLNARIMEAAVKQGLSLHRGVYVQTAGPSFESPAEIRMFGRLGADAVGMSTVTEVIAARHCGLKVAAISCFSNYAAGLTEEPLTIEDITLIAKRSGQTFSALLHIAIHATAGNR